MTDRVCVFEDDDAALEAVRPTVDLLETLDVDVEFTVPPVEKHADDLLDDTFPNCSSTPSNPPTPSLFGSCNPLHKAILWYEERAYFEPVHGTAPDIAGDGVINQTATILSAAMMLHYIDFAGAADRLCGAVESVYRVGEPLTPDQGGSASTEAFAAAVANEL